MLALIAATVVGCSGSGDVARAARASTSPATSAQGVHAQAPTPRGEAVQLLRRQWLAIAAADAARYVRTWSPDAPSARRRALMIYRNLVVLRARPRTISVTAVPAEPAAARADTPGEAQWSVQVQVGWRLAGMDGSDAQVTLIYTFEQRDSQAYVADIAPAAGSRTPIWLLGRLYVHRSARTLVAAQSPQLEAVLARGLTRAVRDVSAVIPRWHGDLVAYAPATTAQFDALLDSPPGRYHGVAAVTTAVDGSRRPDTPVAIVTNPIVFAALSPIGRHVVISHESTHAATGVATVDMPLWVAEGFADYVGVGAVHVPLAVSARHVLHDVRAGEVPTQLPADAGFGGPGAVAQTSYEQAWLAIRLIAKTFGQSTLVTFYRYVVAHPRDQRAAFTTVLHTTAAAFTKMWQRYLLELAGG